MGLLLVADIGGTNARFGLVEQTPNTSKPNYTASQQITLKCANYPDMGSMIKACCAEFKIEMPEYACLAIAGPIEHGFAQMTNLGWKFQINELRDQLGMKTLHVINDFAALAYAVPFLSADETKTLYAADSDPEAPIVVMGHRDA
jgi:glucokinase